MSKSNATKTNATINFSDMFTALCECKTKSETALIYNKYGFKTTTAPTDTSNSGDLYTQFRANKCGDVSRIMFKSKKIHVYASNAVCDGISKLDKSYIFGSCNDGAVRKHHLTVDRTLENFTKIFGYFVSSGIVENLVPVTETTK